MPRYIADQNKVVLLQESGTYAVPTATARWVGQVQEFSIEEAENKIESRYLGNMSRSYATFENGPIDVTGTLTYNPQDMMLLAHAIGSVAESAVGTTNTVKATEVNSDSIQNPFTSGTGKSTTVPFSFTLEDSKQSVGTGKNFIRQVKGCVIDTATLTLSQGEKANVEVAVVAQNVGYASGTTTSITAVTQTPYLWSDATLTLAGSSIDTAKEITLEIANNVEPPHYINGSRVIAEPFAKNRDYTLSVTTDMDNANAKFLYEQYYRGGSTFNVTLDLNRDSTGSQHAIFIMSGCNITSMEMPSTVEGVNEQIIEVRPKNLSMTAYDSISTIGSYNPY